MKRIILLASAALLVATSLHTAAPAHAADCADVDLMPNQITVPQFNAATLCLLNEDRASQGLAPLTESAQLDSSALVHSEEMRRVGFFAHESPDGSPFQNRIINTGYLAGTSSWSVGENIAWGSWNLGTPRAINTAWMNSPHHRDNILDPGYREIGVGSAPGTPTDPNNAGAMIVTHDFGLAVRGLSHPAKKAKKKARAKKRLKRNKRIHSR